MHHLWNAIHNFTAIIILIEFGNYVTSASIKSQLVDAQVKQSNQKLLTGLLSSFKQIHDQRREELKHLEDSIPIFMDSMDMELKNLEKKRDSIINKISDAEHTYDTKEVKNSSDVKDFIMVKSGDSIKNSATTSFMQQLHDFVQNDEMKELKRVGFDNKLKDILHADYQKVKTTMGGVDNQIKDFIAQSNKIDHVSNIPISLARFDDHKIYLQQTDSDVNARLWAGRDVADYKADLQQMALPLYNPNSVPLELLVKRNQVKVPRDRFHSRRYGNVNVPLWTGRDADDYKTHFQQSDSDVNIPYWHGRDAGDHKAYSHQTDNDVNIPLWVQQNFGDSSDHSYQSSDLPIAYVQHSIGKYKDDEQNNKNFPMMFMQNTMGKDNVQHELGEHSKNQQNDETGRLANVDKQNILLWEIKRMSSLPLYSPGAIPLELLVKRKEVKGPRNQFPGRRYGREMNSLPLSFFYERSIAIPLKRIFRRFHRSAKFDKMYGHVKPRGSTVEDGVSPFMRRYGK